LLISWTVDTICPLLEKGEHLAMATVISKSGSAPCLAGSKLILLDDDASFGTIGGGVLEAEALRQARKVLSTGISRHFTFDLTGRDAASMAMICGGRVEVFVEHLAADPATLQVFKELGRALAEGEKCFLVSDLGPADAGLPTIERCLLNSKGQLTGTFAHGSDALATLVERAKRSIYPLLTDLAGRRFLVERCFSPSKVWLFGAGHVAQCVAELVQRVEFQVGVLDDRPEFANRERFPTADEVRVLASFDRCLEHLELDADSYAIIVTRGHTHDLTVLEQVLRTQAGYLGLLGSRKKIHEIRKALAASGFAQEDLERIHCPIGLDIDAETPGEIAFSIVAELIQARAGKRL